MVQAAAANLVSCDRPCVFEKAISSVSKVSAEPFNAASLRGMSCITTAATTHHRRASMPALRQAGALWLWWAQGDSAWCERLEGVEGRGARVGRVGILPVRADGQGEQGGAGRVSEAGRRLRAGGGPGRADGPGRLMWLACRASGGLDEQALVVGPGSAGRAGGQGQSAGWVRLGRRAGACGAPAGPVHGRRVAGRGMHLPGLCTDTGLQGRGAGQAPTLVAPARLDINFKWAQLSRLTRLYTTPKLSGQCLLFSRCCI
jgi:hypothetical protein